MQPPSFIIAGEENRVLRLSKVLDVLCQAPHAWHGKLDASLVALSFQCSKSEHTMYMHSGGPCRLIVGVYVDNLIITGGDITELKQLKDRMKSTFQMANLNLQCYYLGLEVNQA
jgi:hypothetical protein